jgi:phosphoglycerate dehydrogenase-like enzyme
MSLNVFHYTETKQGSPDALAARLAQGIDFSHGRVVPNPAAYDILIAASPSEELLEASPRLQALIIPFAGLPENTRALLRNYPQISVHNAPYNYVATAETALALMLASAKFVVEGDKHLRRNDWTVRYSDRPQLLLQGRTVLILGYGRIGRYMAPVCRALGMSVIGMRRTLQPEDRTEPGVEIYGVEQLHALLPRADVLLVALPGTPQTTDLIGEKELAALPKDALLVNVGRGSVVDETALYQALVSGKLVAAGLDVWYRYPRTKAERTKTAPSQHPFHRLDNVILSPHRAGWLGREDESRMAFLAEMLNKAASGQPLPNRIDLERGY